MARRRTPHTDEAKVTPTKSQTVEVSQAPKIALEPWLTMPNGARAKRCTYVRHAKQQRPFTQCEKPAAYGTERCITHGAKNYLRQGPMNPNWKGGATKISRERWTNRLQGPMQEEYLAALRDPEILNLEHEIALIDVRLGNLVGQVGQPSDWSEVRAVYDELKAATDMGNIAGIRLALTKFKDLAYNNAANDRAWREVVKLTDRRRRLVESERRRMVEQNLFLSREQAHSYGNALLEACTSEVSDRETLLRIVAKFRAILDAGRHTERDRAEGALALVYSRTRGGSG